MIAVVDSGIGGLPYLQHLRGQLPQEEYLYCADNLGFPYGTKNETEIITTFSSMVDRILAHHTPDIFVVACNTASVVALHWLREHYSIPFVGVVPAVKPAAAASTSRVIAVLATERTCKGQYLEDLVTTWATDCSVLKRPATKLISHIESDPFGRDRATLELLLGEVRSDLLEAGADSIVLGCTHFLLFEDLFVEILGPAFKIHDSRAGVSKQTLKVLGKIPQSKEKQGIGNFWLTGDPKELKDRYRSVAEHWNLHYQGVLGA